MKRLHVHIAVDDLQRSIGFYSALFAAQPSVTKTDYAKWMLDMNFSHTSCSGTFRKISRKRTSRALCSRPGQRCGKRSTSVETDH